jgi:hypothetical protein
VVLVQAHGDDKGRHDNIREEGGPDSTVSTHRRLPIAPSSRIGKLHRPDTWPGADTMHYGKVRTEGDHLVTKELKWAGAESYFKVKTNLRMD